VLALVIVEFAGCSSEPVPTSQSTAQLKKPTVFVVNYPLAYFARRMGRESVDVVFPVPDEFDPAHWDPDAEDIAAFQSADLVLLNGADYAKWTLRATLPWSRTVVTTRDVEDKYIEVPDAVTHSHGPEGEHTHAVLASETWLDPKLAIAQARIVKDELEKLVPDSAGSINANCDALIADLQSLDEEFKSTFAQSCGLWTASHPAFSYIGRRYSLELEIVHWTPNEFPSEHQWDRFEKLVAESTTSWMLWEDDPIQETVDRLRTLGVRIAVFSPAENRPDKGDYLTVMRRNLGELQAALSAPPQPQ
jgi:zinc transport system substrate-binding protein